MDTLDNPLMWANFLLWSICTLLILICGGISLKLANQIKAEENFPQKKNLSTWGYFFTLLAISNILILVWRFVPLSNQAVDFIERIANSLFYVAVFVRVLDIEKRVLNRKRYYFSSFVAVSIGINLFVPPWFLKSISPWQVIFLILVTIGYSVFPVIYFYVSRKAVGEVRSNALKASAGAVFLALGYLFRPENVVAYQGISQFGDAFITSLYISAPIYIILGIVLIYLSFRKIKD